MFKTLKRCSHLLDLPHTLYYMQNDGFCCCFRSMTECSKHLKGVATYWTCLRTCTPLLHVKWFLFRCFCCCFRSMMECSKHLKGVATYWTYLRTCTPLLHVKWWFLLLLFQKYDEVAKENYALRLRLPASPLRDRTNVPPLTPQTAAEDKKCLPVWHKA